jgi:hypothetical protein
MLDVPQLLDERWQVDLRQALSDSGFGEEAEHMEPETIAELAIVARHPPEVRPMALVTMAGVPHAELDALELIECEDRDGLAWSLTEKGREMADVLARAIPERSAEQRVRDDEALRERLAGAHRALDEFEHMEE